MQWLTGQRAQYSIGFTLPSDFAAQVKILDEVDAWEAALAAEERVRPDATGLLDLSSWPAGMRVIVRKEKPNPRRAATDHRRQWLAGDGVRDQHPAAGGPTAPAPIRSCVTAAGPAARTASASPKTYTGLTNLPLHDFDQNRIWLAIVALAVELTAWWQMLALTNHPARRRLHLAASAP